MTFRIRPLLSRTLLAATIAAGATLMQGAAASAQVTAYKQAVAEAAYQNDGIAAYYRSVDYAPLWTGEGDEHRARRAALLDALKGASVHGLPDNRYDIPGLMRQMREARTTRDMGLVEVALSRTFVRFARDLRHGVIEPRKVDSGIVRQIDYVDPARLLTDLSNSAPVPFMHSLAPQTREYRALLKQKLRLEQVVARGGWGPKVPVKALKPGASGSDVVALRNRMMAMGHMKSSAAVEYDTALSHAVQAFQGLHGLEPDGVAGAGTMTEINVPAIRRLQSVLVAMERERWLGRERGERHVLVNLTDFHAQIIDNDKVTFRTRSVVGKNVSDRRTPEFSDVMEHMVINPSWYVPRSIITKEYLPRLRNNPNAAGHIQIRDARGRVISRDSVDFTQYSARNFPFNMVQPPSGRNALGLVKFMFPNKYNIYLHDTPEKHLFKREVRAYSHGCIRLGDPFDFAYALLAVQEDNPEEFFQSILRTRRETRVNLETPIPVHLIYRTAFTSPRGEVNFRRDVYGRDARIWDAMQAAGVVLPEFQG